MGKQGNKVAGGQSVLTWIVQISESIYFQIINILRYDNGDGDWCDLGKWFWGIQRSMGLCGPFLD